MDNNQNQKLNFSVEDILSCRVTDETKIIKSKPIIKIRNGIWGRRGDFCVMMGKRKVGKTTVQQTVIATSFMEIISENVDTLGIRTEYNKGKDVLYFDTEGSMEDTNDFRLGVNRILGLEETPTNFHTYNFRPYTQDQTKMLIESAFINLHKDPHLIVIDGVADLITSPNNEKESNEIVRWIMKYASELNTCIVCVIHENYGNDAKARGHLGSELERKCGGAIAVCKDPTTRTHTIECRFLRKSEDFEPIGWLFDKELKRPVSVELTNEQRTAITQKDYQRTKELTTLRNQCFLGLDIKSEKELKASLRLYQAKSSDPTKQSRRNIGYMMERGLIYEEEREDGKYYQSINLKGNQMNFEKDCNQLLEEVAVNF